MLSHLLRTGGAGALVGLCGSRVVRLAYKGQERMDREEADKVRRSIGGKKAANDVDEGFFGAIGTLAVLGLLYVAFSSDDKKSDRK
jgi:hypothetical protein